MCVCVCVCACVSEIFKAEIGCGCLFVVSLWLIKCYGCGRV